MVMSVQLVGVSKLVKHKTYRLTDEILMIETP